MQPEWRLNGSRDSYDLANRCFVVFVSCLSPDNEEAFTARTTPNVDRTKYLLANAWTLQCPLTVVSRLVEAKLFCHEEGPTKRKTRQGETFIQTVHSARDRARL